MDVDWTKGVKRTKPEHGGESPVTLRTVKVDTVNADGTVDIDVNGVVVPGCHRVDQGALIAGQPVQVLAHLDGFLVLGPVAALPAIPVGRFVARLRRDANQSVNDNTQTPIIWDTIDEDPLVGWDAGDPTRWTPPVAGWYTIIGRAVFAANATSRRYVAVRFNGSTTSPPGSVTSVQTPATGTCQIHTQAVIEFNGTTDYVEVNVLQNSTGALNLTNTDGGSALIAYYSGSPVGFP